MALTTILWDMGGVVCNFYQDVANSRLSRKSRLGKTVKDVSDILFGSSATDRQYNQGLTENYYLGKESSEDFYRNVRDALDLDMSYAEFVHSWGDIFSLNEEIMKFIRDLNKKSYIQGVLSSTNPIHWLAMDYLSGMESLLGRRNIICTFDPDAGYKKPTPQLFAAVENRLQVPRQEIVYVDDVRRYSEAAIQEGFGAAIRVDQSVIDYQTRCISEIKQLGFRL